MQTISFKRLIKGVIFSLLLFPFSIIPVEGAKNSSSSTAMYSPNTYNASPSAGILDTTHFTYYGSYAARTQCDGETRNFASFTYKAEAEFWGSGIDIWLGKDRANGGYTDIYIDGSKVGTVYTYNYDDMVCTGGSSYWGTTGLSPGKHIISVVPQESWREQYIWAFRPSGSYDTTAPNNPTNISVSTSVAQQTWTNAASPSFTWTGATDNSAGVEGYEVYFGTSSTATSGTYQITNTYTASFLSTGKYYLRLRTRDAANNNASWTTMYEYWVDTASPTVVSGLSELSGVANNTWQKTINSPSFSWSASNDTDSGLAGYNVYWGTSATGTGTLQTEAGYSHPLVADTGTYYLRVNSQDNAGNQTAYTTFVFKYDISNPTPTLGISGTAGSNGWYTSSVNLNPSGTDIGSGLANAYVSVDSGTWSGSTTISSSGSHSISYRAVDNVGNESTINGSIKVDLEDPTVSPSVVSGILGENGWYTVAPVINIGGTDNTSGVAKQEYSMDGGTSWTTTADGSLTAPEGITSYTFKVTDNAGRTSSSTAIYKVDTIDPIASPTLVSGTAGTNGWYISQVTIDPGAGDTGSGVQKIEVEDNSSWSTISGNHSLSDGEHNIIFRVTDNAGRMILTSSETIKQDTQKPTAFKNPRYRISGGQIIFTIDFGDDVSGGSGSRGVACSLTPGAISTSDTTASTCEQSYPLISGTKTMYVKTLDQAGNWSSEGTATVDAFINPTVTIDSHSPNPSNLDQTYSVIVSVSGAGLIPTGSVSVNDGTGQTCSITLAAGTGSCDLTSITAGAKTLTATYSGDDQYLSEQTTTSHTVNKATPSVLINSHLPDPSVINRAFSISVTITGLTTTPTGSVSIDDGAGQTCSITLAAGTGSCDLTSITAGAKTLTAAYSGDSNYSLNSSTASHNVTELPQDILLSKTTIATSQSIVGAFNTSGGQAPFSYTFMKSGSVCTIAIGVDNDKFSVDGSNNLLLNSGVLAGTYRICLEVNDKNADSYQKAFVIEVTNPPGEISLSKSSGSITKLNIGELSIPSGGQAPIVYSMSSTGSICNASNSHDNSSFQISGSILQRKSSTAAGDYNICVQGTDANGLISQKAVALHITNPPSSIALSSDEVTTSDTQVGLLSTVDGLAPYTYGFGSGTPGCDDNSFFSISNQVINRIASTGVGSYNICVMVTDANFDSFSQAFTLTVSATTVVAASPSELSLSSTKLIDGDTSTTVGTIVSINSDLNPTYDLVDSDSYPDNNSFEITNGNELVFNGLASRTNQDTYNILLEENAPTTSRYLEETISVMGSASSSGGSIPETEITVPNNVEVELDTTKEGDLPNGASYWLPLEIVEMPDHGEARVGSIIYKSDPGYSGVDVVTYRACANTGECVLSSVTYSVLPPNADELPQTGFAPNLYTKINQLRAEFPKEDLTLEIPSLNLNQPIVGVPFPYDVSWLGRDIGWLSSTAYPGQPGNSILTGHIFNYDGNPGVFRLLATLKFDDDIIINGSGNQLVYKVRSIERVDAGDYGKVFKHEEYSWLTLITCSDYNEKTGEYLKRTVVRAILVGEKN